MGIMLLMGLLFGGVALFVESRRKTCKTGDKELKWLMVAVIAVAGMALGGVLSNEVGVKIAKKRLASQAPVTVLENIDLLPFPNSGVNVDSFWKWFAFIPNK